MPQELFFRYGEQKEKTMKKCNLVFSKHAQIRCSQRSIDLETCQLLQSYGISCHDNRGGLIIKFNKDSFDAIQAEMGKKTRIRMEKKKNAYLVQATDTGTIITTCRSFIKRR